MKAVAILIVVASSIAGGLGAAVAVADPSPNPDLAPIDKTFYHWVIRCLNTNWEERITKASARNCAARCQCTHSGYLMLVHSTGCNSRFRKSCRESGRCYCVEERISLTPGGPPEWFFGPEIPSIPMKPKLIDDEKKTDT